MKNLKGLYAALITPYCSDGTVDYVCLRNIVEYLIEAGLDGFYVSGSTGEAFLLTVDERKKILETVVDQNRGRKNIIAHTGSIGTDLTISLSVHAKQCGADAISAVTPFYYKFTKAEICSYYEAIAERVDMPTIIYNFPDLTGFSITMEILDNLSQKPNIAGVKFTSKDMYVLERFKYRHPELLVFNGYDEIMISGLLSGADGGIGSTYNFMPELYVKQYRLFHEGRIQEAVEVQHRINNVIDIVAKYGAMNAAKEFLRLKGLITEDTDCREPFSPLSEAAKADIRRNYEANLKDIGLW